jgi:putative DNA primase/helicase
MSGRGYGQDVSGGKAAHAAEVGTLMTTATAQPNGHRHPSGPAINVDDPVEAGFRRLDLAPPDRRYAAVNEVVRSFIDRGLLTAEVKKRLYQWVDKVRLESRGGYTSAQIRNIIEQTPAKPAAPAKPTDDLEHRTASLLDWLKRTYDAADFVGVLRDELDLGVRLTPTLVDDMLALARQRGFVSAELLKLVGADPAEPAPRPPEPRQPAAPVQPRQHRAGPFPEEFLDELRARLPVSVVAGRRVKLSKQGREFVGLSPFKEERTASFTVNDEKGFFHDFSSGKHGDIFKFIRETEGVGFPDAVRRAADMAGVSLPGHNNDAPKPKGRAKDEGGAAAGPQVPDTDASPKRTSFEGFEGGGGDEKIDFANPLAPPFQYHDEHGSPLYERIKLGYIDKDGKPVLKESGKRKKTFLFRRPNGAGGWIWGLKDKKTDLPVVQQVPYRLPELLAERAADRTVIVISVESERTVDLLRKWGVTATCVQIGTPNFTGYYEGADHVFLRDKGDETRSAFVLKALHGVAGRQRVLDLPGLQDKQGPDDWVERGGTLEQLLELIESQAQVWTPPGQQQQKAHPQPNDQRWPEPKELPGGLAKVGVFEATFLPDAIAPWVMDIADRMQCPPDLVAIPAVTALGTLIGRRCGVRPERNTDWTEFANLWGCAISRPGLMKSPAMKSALGPLYKLEAEAFKTFQDERVQYEADLVAYKLKRSVEEAKAKAAAKKGEELEYKLEAAPDEPQAKRYATNDSSYQELGRMLAANSSILVTRDEVVSLLRYLDQEQSSEARGFYLTGWNGNSPYTFDRVGRGTTRVEAVCIGIIGCATPDAIGDYVRRAMMGGSGDDGLIQRFGLMVWPDQVGEWQNTDRGLNSVAREAAYDLFQKLSLLGPTSVGDPDPFGGPPFLRFDDYAIGTFLEWRTPFETMLRSDDLHPALTSHFAKYRKLVPTLALINHLCTGERTKPIGSASLLKAIRFSDYLAGHARRVYGSRREVEVGAAKAILSRIRSGDLTEGDKGGFTARDIHQRDWSKLTDIEHIRMGLEILVDYDWITTVNMQAGAQSGRPTVRYAINPRAHEK